MKIIFPLSSTVPWLQTKLRANTKTHNHHRHRYVHRRNRLPPMSPTHSHRSSKKRKFVYEEQTLTLNRCSVQCSSSSNQSQQSTRHCYQRIGEHTRDSRRKWAYSNLDCSDFGDKLVLVSYNILGVENASRHPDLYSNIPWKYMDWDYRRACIRKEMTKYNPSILCFQEVDRFSDLRDALQQDGFEGVLKARTGDACDGCAIFWKDERFTLLQEENIEFQSFGLRNNVAQLCVLKMKENGLNSDLNPTKSKISKSRSLVVGNIHVLFNPNRGDIKLGQIRMFLEKAKKLSEEWGGIPVVLAGDFNSVPQSALYQYISSAKLNVLQHDRKRISGQFYIPLRHTTFRSSTEESCGQELLYRWNDEEIKLATGNEQVTCLQHHLNLRSVYLGIPGNDKTRDKIGEPSVTSCHSKFTGTVDYIWHSEELIPLRVLESLPVNVLRNIGGLPNKKWGSDHLALVCEFAFSVK